MEPVKTFAKDGTYNANMLSMEQNFVRSQLFLFQDLLLCPPSVQGHLVGPINYRLKFWESSLPMNIGTLVYFGMERGFWGYVARLTSDDVIGKFVILKEDLPVLIAKALESGKPKIAKALNKFYSVPRNSKASNYEHIHVSSIEVMKAVLNKDPNAVALFKKFYMQPYLQSGTILTQDIGPILYYALTKDQPDLVTYLVSDEVRAVHCVLTDDLPELMPEIARNGRSDAFFPLVESWDMEHEGGRSMMFTTSMAVGPKFCDFKIVKYFLREHRGNEWVDRMPELAVYLGNENAVRVILNDCDMGFSVEDIDKLIQKNEERKCSVKEKQPMCDLLLAYADSLAAPPSAETASQESGEYTVVDHEDVNMCTICYDAPKQYANFPCGHMIYCEECHADDTKRTDNCPICRAPVLETRRVFLN